MGCCSTYTANLNFGLVIPDQELAISEVESSHIFGRIDTLKFIQQFKSYPSNVFHWEFYKTCQTFGISSDEMKTSEMSLYVSQLQCELGKINVKLLMVSSILLSTCDWKLKLCELFDLYRNRNHIGKGELDTMLTDMIHVSTLVHPMMCFSSASPEHIYRYVSTIKTAEHYLKSIVTALIHKNMTQDELTLHFSKHPEQQKIFWPNGIRMILVEGNIQTLKESKESSYEENLETEHCSPRNTMNGMFNDSSSAF